MKILKIAFGYFTFALLSLPLFSQDDQYNPDLSYSKELLEEDFKKVIEGIKNYHPQPYQYLPQEIFIDLSNEYQRLFERDMTEKEFHILIRSFIKNIKCGHTYARPSDEWYTYIRSHQSLLPFNITVIDGKSYINSIYISNDTIQIRDELISINNKPVYKILESMRTIQQRDGETNAFVDHNIQKLFRTYYLFLYGFEEEVKLTLKDSLYQTKTLTLPYVNPYKKAVSFIKKNHPPNEFSLVYESKGSNFYLDSISNTYFLDINSFSRKGYKKYYKRIFKHLKKSKADHLIIDLRNNGGGYFPNGNKLLNYLYPNPIHFSFYTPKRKRKKLDGLKMDFGSKMTRFAFNTIPGKHKIKGQKTYRIKFKPRKNRFKGKVTLLQNGGTFSMSSYVSSFLKNNSNVQIIGSESGGGEHGSNAILNHTLTLPNTNIIINIPYYHLDHTIDTPDKGRGVIPDIEIPISKQHYFNNIDEALKKAILSVPN